MPNNPTLSNVAKNAGGVAKSLSVSAAGTLNTSPVSTAAATALNQSVSTVIKASAGFVFNVNVVTAGSTTGSFHDCATTGAAAASNLIFTIPDAIGNYPVNFPCQNGIVFVPGTSQVVAIAFE